MRPPLGIVLAAFAAGGTAVAAAPALACTSASCSLASRGPAGSLARGSSRIELSYRHADFDRPMYGGEAIPWPALRPRVDHVRGLLIPGFHQELEQKAQALQVDLSHAVTGGLVLTLSVPMATRRTVTHVLVPGSDPRLHEEGGASGGRNVYSLDGIGDVQISAVQSFRVGGGRFAPGLGVKLRTGRSDFEGPDGGLADPMVQPGTGAMAVIGSLRYETRLSAGPTSLVALLSHQRNRADARGYRFGAESFAVVAVSRPLRGRLSAGALLKAQHDARNVYRGSDSVSTGGVVASVGPTLRIVGPGGAALTAAAQFPFLQRFHEYALGSHATLTVGVSKDF